MRRSRASRQTPGQTVGQTPPVRQNKDTGARRRTVEWLRAHPEGLFTECARALGVSDTLAGRAAAREGRASRRP